MCRKITTILLSLLMVWYAAGQVRGEKKHGGTADGIAVFESTRMRRNAAEEIYGQIRATAALRVLSADQEASVQFLLEGENGTYAKSVSVTPDSRDEHDLLSASAVFMDLESGVYELKIDHLQNAVLDYILAEDGDGSKYRMEKESIVFELSHDARLGSAWFMLQETGGEKNDRSK